MFVGLVGAAVFQLDASVLAEGHQVREQEAVSRFDLVFVFLGCFGIGGADRVADERQSHVASAPIVAATAPFLGARAVGLRCLAVIKEEPGVAFQRVQDRSVGEDK